MEVWFQDAVTRRRRRRPVHHGGGDAPRPAPRLRGPGGGGPDRTRPRGVRHGPRLRGRFRAAHPRIGDRPVVLFLGRLNFKKGIDILVHAFSEALRAAPRAHLVIAGPDGGLRARTEAWIGAHGLRDRTTLLDMVTGPDKLALLADADLFVLPSWTENFGIAVIEALACGLPVVVSDRVNLWREVAGAGAGWVVPPAPGPTRDAIVEALRDPVRAREKGARGRDLVAERFAWTRIATRMEEVYASVAGTGAGAGGVAPGDAPADAGRATGDRAVQGSGRIARHARRTLKLLRLLPHPVFRRGLRLGVGAAVEHRDVLASLAPRTVVDVGATPGSSRCSCGRCTRGRGSWPSSRSPGPRTGSAACSRTIRA